MVDIIKEMNDVIESSKQIRNRLNSNDVTLEQKKKELEIHKTTISANKNIVSASIVIINANKLGMGNGNTQ